MYVVKRLRTSASFRTLQAASASASRAGKGNKSRGTKPELELTRLLRRLRFKFELHPRLVGKPDAILGRHNVAIFCDGDFWHGRRWAERQRKLAKGNNAMYWLRKIRDNRNRDRRVNYSLRKRGWVVIRVWASDLASDPERVVNRIRAAVAATHKTVKPKHTALQTNRNASGTSLAWAAEWP
jgi:DNA mismatch endonuclease, patch repair protein